MINNIDDLFDSQTDLMDEVDEAPFNSPSQCQLPCKYTFVISRTPFSEKNDSEVAQHHGVTRERKTLKFAAEDDEKSPRSRKNTSSATKKLIFDQ